jgi:hypothetical protein
VNATAVLLLGTALASTTGVADGGAAPDPLPVSATEGMSLAPAPPSSSSPIWTVPVWHTTGVVLGMRLGLSILWPEAYAPLPLERSARQYRLAWTMPPEYRRDRRLFESDGDPWVINVVGHGLFGAEVHGRVRACHGSFWQAAAFTAGASVLWEYGPEAFHKRPSAVDLMITPVLGAALGEGRHQLQRWIRTRPRTAWRRVLEILIDPLGEGERGLLGTRC